MRILSALLGFLLIEEFRVGIFSAPAAALSSSLLLAYLSM